MEVSILRFDILKPHNKIFFSVQYKCRMSSLKVVLCSDLLEVKLDHKTVQSKQKNHYHPVPFMEVLMVISLRTLAFLNFFSPPLPPISTSCLAQLF